LEFAGGRNGFVDGALLCKSSKESTDDYHHNMDFFSFSNWFRKFLELPQLRAERHIIVYDNAPFHGQDHLPKSNAKKAEYVEFLNALGHEVTEEEYLRMELWEMVKVYKKSDDEQIIDRLAKSKGHVPLRIPPYHCKKVYDLSVD
jgi:hypothetical protein